MIFKDQVGQYLKIKLPRIIGVLMSFILVTVAWIFFRAETFPDAISILGIIINGSQNEIFSWSLDNDFGNTVFVTFGFLVSAIAIFLMFFFEARYSARLKELDARPWEDVIFFSFFIWFTLTFGVFQSASFIYFQF